MVRARFRGIGMGLMVLIGVAGACREREPSPPYNRNLGGEGEYLLPIPSPDVGPELSGNRGVKIPDRSEAAQIKPRTEQQPDQGTEAGAVEKAPTSGPGGKKDKGAISGFLGRLRGEGHGTEDKRPPGPKPKGP
jgi:hypothetical protein